MIALSFRSHSSRHRRPSRSGGEEGHLLIGVMILVTVMAILSGVGVQHWSIIEKRDREAQLQFIQKQYALALLEYQTERGAAPVELELLDERGGRGQRYIRRMWTDPMTRDSDGGEEGLDRWCLIQTGPNNEVVNSCPQESQQEFVIGEESTLVAQGGEGLPIVGVASRNSEDAYRIWNDRKKYNEWIYTVRDLEAEANQLVILQ